MKLIIGLGNPGREYQGTRHNAGAMVVEQLARRHHLDEQPARTRFHGRALEGSIAEQRCLLLAPMTYMNRSGVSVGEALRFYKLDAAEDLLIVVDDVALALGRIRLRANGSPGGHNGLKDIRRVLGDDTYPRLRIGIDAPGRTPQIDYVLGRFTAAQLDTLAPALTNACDAIECWLSDGIERSMTRYNAEA
jgi:PTH1 family peptidyl-tRNA hydrolase